MSGEFGYDTTLSSLDYIVLVYLLLSSIFVFVAVATLAYAM